MTQTVTQTPTQALTPPKQWQQFVRAFMKNKGAVLGLIVLIIFVLIAFLAPWLAPHDPYELFQGKEQLPPSFVDGGEAAFLLGTDDAGRDTLSRVL